MPDQGTVEVALGLLLAVWASIMVVGVRALWRDRDAARRSRRRRRRTA